jgi:hypothetical protein
MYIPFLYFVQCVKGYKSRKLEAIKLKVEGFYKV